MTLKRRFGVHAVIVAGAVVAPIATITTAEYFAVQ
jgi:hypothetical protein